MVQISNTLIIAAAVAFAVPVLLDNHLILRAREPGGCWHVVVGRVKTRTEEGGIGVDRRCGDLPAMMQ